MDLDNDELKETRKNKEIFTHGRRSGKEVESALNFRKCILELPDNKLCGVKHMGSTICLTHSRVVPVNIIEHYFHTAIHYEEDEHTIEILTELMEKILKN